MTRYLRYRPALWRKQGENADRVVTRADTAIIAGCAPQRFKPMPLSRFREPFDDPEWIFELKYDGFRALLWIGGGHPEFVSRKANTFQPLVADCRDSKATSAATALGLTASGRVHSAEIYSRRTATVSLIAGDLPPGVEQ